MTVHGPHRPPVGVGITSKHHKKAIHVALFRLMHPCALPSLISLQQAVIVPQPFEDFLLPSTPVQRKASMIYNIDRILKQEG